MINFVANKVRIELNFQILTDSVHKNPEFLVPEKIQIVQKSLHQDLQEKLAGYEIDERGYEARFKYLDATFGNLPKLRSELWQKL